VEKKLPTSQQNINEGLAAPQKSKQQQSKGVRRLILKRSYSQISNAKPLQQSSGKNLSFYDIPTSPKTVENSGRGKASYSSESRACEVSEQGVLHNSLAKSKILEEDREKFESKHFFKDQVKIEKGNTYSYKAPCLSGRRLNGSGYVSGCMPGLRGTASPSVMMDVTDGNPDEITGEYQLPGTTKDCSSLAMDFTPCVSPLSVKADMSMKHLRSPFVLDLDIGKHDNNMLID